MMELLAETLKVSALIGLGYALSCVSEAPATLDASTNEPTSTYVERSEHTMSYFISAESFTMLVDAGELGHVYDCPICAQTDRPVSFTLKTLLAHMTVYHAGKHEDVRAYETSSGETRDEPDQLVTPTATDDPKPGYETLDDTGNSSTSSDDAPPAEALAAGWDCDTTAAEGW
jgi:hypothetical protein